MDGCMGIYQWVSIIDVIGGVSGNFFNLDVFRDWERVEQVNIENNGRGNDTIVFMVWITLVEIKE